MKERKSIFLMVVVNGNPEERDSKLRLRSRCWGYYFDRAVAEKAIEENWTDMSEMEYYKYAVLVEQGQGPLPEQEELQWYEFVWNWCVPPREHDGIVIPEFVEARKIDKPEQYSQILFGM
jgi:hypothetical protein